MRKTGLLVVWRWRKRCITVDCEQGGGRLQGTDVVVVTRDNPMLFSKTSLFNVTTVGKGKMMVNRCHNNSDGGGGEMMTPSCTLYTAFLPQ